MPAFERPSAISAEHLALARREHVERVVDAARGDELLDERRVDHRAALDDPLQRVGELVDVGDAALEQVAAAPCPPASRSIACSTSTCAESTTMAVSGQLRADRARRVEALGRVRRRHADVDDGELGPVLAHERDRARRRRPPGPRPRSRTARAGSRALRGAGRRRRPATTRVRGLGHPLDYRLPSTRMSLGGAPSAPRRAGRRADAAGSTRRSTPRSRRRACGFPRSRRAGLGARGRRAGAITLRRCSRSARPRPRRRPLLHADLPSSSVAGIGGVRPALRRRGRRLRGGRDRLLPAVRHAAVDRPVDLVALVAFVVVGGAVGILVDDLTRLAADLDASRARIVAAADEARRQIERDLHDGRSSGSSRSASSCARRRPRCRPSWPSSTAS